MANQTYFCTLTAIGEAKDANAKALGTALKLTEMAVGDGNGALPIPDRARTTLVRQVRRAPLNTLKADPQNPGQLIAEQIIPEDVGGWWIRELGIYDDAGDLIAIGNCPETYKPQLAEGSGRVQVVRMVLIMSSAATVQLKIDPSVVLATRKYVDDQDAAVEARMNTAVAALGASTQTALGGKADLAGATFTGPVYASKGFRIGGAWTLTPSASPGSFSLENITMRNYIGDGTGWAWAFSKRANGVTTDLFTVNDAGNVGIGVDAPAARLDVGGSASAALQAILARGASDGGFQLRARNGWGNAVDTEQVRFGMEYASQGMAAGFSFIRGASATNSSLAIFTDNLERVRVDATGNLGIGTQSPKGTLHVSKPGEASVVVSNYQNSGADNVKAGSVVFQTAYTSTGTVYENARIDAITKAGNIDISQLVFSVGRFGAGGLAQEAMRIDSNGNLLVGVTSSTCHVVSKGNAVVDTRIFDVAYSTGFFVGDGYGFSATAACQKVMRNATSGRSINASGTINAGGADYAEYMTKASTCGEIDKGQIVGVDRAGLLTDKWADAVSFLIKSTDPSYVGGDTWGHPDAIGMARPEEPVLGLADYTGTAHPGEAPVAPSAPDLTQPVLPSMPADDASEEEKEAYLVAQTAYSEQLDAFNEAQAAYLIQLADHKEAMQVYTKQLAEFERDLANHLVVVEAARAEFDTVTMPAYLEELAAFEAALEQARQRVDRIAYCGQVPVNVKGAKPGQYVVPVQDGDGIGGQLVDDDAIDFKQYRRAVGIVQNVLEDGRANVRVKIV